MIDPAALAGLRAAIERAGFTESRIAAALGPRPPLRRTRREVYRRRLAEAGELGTLVRLFHLRDPVAPAEVSALGIDVDGLLEAAVLERRDDDVGAAVALTPYEDLVLAHDHADSSERPASEDVLFGSASRSLAALTIRRPARRALDLGTGCGVQALLASRHARQVVATDVADRALGFTRLNAALNGIENVETRRGSFFEPVQGERFDLISSNPPFVVSPDSELVFRDSELPRDEVSRHVVAEAQAHLEDGGHAAILASWIAPSDEHWSTPLRRWIDAGSDALLMHFTSVSPFEYAATWTDEIERWLAYYRSEGIERISTGAVILRRRRGGRITAYQANSAPRLNAGDQLVRILDAEPLDDASLLGTRLRLEDHRLREEATFGEGGYTIELTGVEIPGSPLNARVEPLAVHVLPHLDGSDTVGAVIERTARETGLALEEAALTTVRRLYARGFLSGPRP